MLLEMAQKLPSCKNSSAKNDLLTKYLHFCFIMYCWIINVWKIDGWTFYSYDVASLHSPLVPCSIWHTSCVASMLKVNKKCLHAWGKWNQFIPNARLKAEWDTHHLICQQKDGLYTELSIAEIEQVFQTWAEQFHYKHIVVTLCATPPDPWNADWRV